MKTDGVDVETSQLTSPGSLLKLVTVALIAAIRVMRLVIGRDGGTGQQLTDVIDDPAQVPGLQAINATLQSRTQKLKNPHHPASLAWYAWIAARSGGWSGYTSKGYKPPGPKIMARGLKNSMPWSRVTRAPIVPHLPDSRSPQGERENVAHRAACPYDTRHE